MGGTRRLARVDISAYNSSVERSVGIAMKPWLGITWSISNRFGWGVYGLNLVLETLKRPAPFPVCLNQIVTDSMSEELVHSIQRAIAFRQQNVPQLFRAGQTAQMQDSIVLHGLGNGMEWPLISESVTGDSNIGVIFFEHTDISPAGKARLSKLNGTIAGSTWNADVLKGWGIENVRAVFQGVDTQLFYPRVKGGKYKDKFAVFSGGKLDYRKGQDIVLAAFKRFAERHDDVILVTAWQNLWPLTALRMTYGAHVDTLPMLRPDGTLNLTRWAAEHGVAPEKFVDLGMQRHEDMPEILRDMDLAVFPNRCEGGTNLVAMETMASGIPCVIADNTGQKDLISGENCYALKTQSPVKGEGFGTAGWGESDVDELVEAMESAYQNREDAVRRGRRGADFMHEWTWAKQIAQLLETIDELC